MQVLGRLVTADGDILPTEWILDSGRLFEPTVSLVCRAGQASLTLRMLDLEAAGTAAAVLAGLLPPLATLGRLTLVSCSLSADSWAGCHNLLAPATSLKADTTLNRGASLPACLGALLSYTPRLRQLELIGLGADAILDIEQDVEHDTLAAGLPPELAALAHLVHLRIPGYGLRALPDGVYLNG